MIKNCQKSIFDFSHITKKLKIEFEITKNGNELFEIIKNWKLNWKLPKNQFSTFFVIWKIKNWIENCSKSIFIFLKLLKIEQKWTFSYTDVKGCFRYIFASFVCLKESTCKTKKNSFYFISKAFLVLEIIKF